MDNAKYNDAKVAEKPAASYGELRGMCGYATEQTSEPCRQSLRDSVQIALYRADSQAVSAERMRELAHLLDKHPDVARILDLMGISNPIL